MALSNSNYNYKQDYARYRHYFGRVYQYYQKPMAKVSTALLLTIFTTIFFAVFAIRPTLITIAELLRKIEDQRQTLSDMKKKAAALNAASQEYEAASATISRLNQAVPENESVAPLLKMIEGSAAENQSAIVSIKVEEYEYGPKVLAKNTTPQELEVVTSAEAPYPSLKELLKDLFFIPRLLSIDTVTVNSGKDQAGEGIAEKINLTIGSRVFYLPKQNSAESNTGVE